MSRRARRPLVVLALAAVVATTGAAPVVAAGSVVTAQSQSYPGVDELWEEYPLDEPRRGDEGGGASATQARPPRDDAAQAAPERRDEARGEQEDATVPAAPPTGEGARPAAERVGTSGAGAFGVPVAVVAAVGGAMLAALALAVAFRRARRRRLQADPYATSARQVNNVYAEGFTERDGIGAFSGFVHAVAGGFDDTDDMLCIGDPRGGDPLWVRRSEVTALRTVQPAASIPTQDRPHRPDRPGTADPDSGTPRDAIGGRPPGPADAQDAVPRGSRFTPTGRSSRARGPVEPSGGAGRRRR